MASIRPCATAAAGAELYVGLKRGVTRSEFERSIHTGAVADCLHRVGVKKGDVMFLPSGRVHAIGAGLVIVEIQQNSDTTYRVFDWNRQDANGQRRELHIGESLESIDFDDWEPSLSAGSSVRDEAVSVRRVVRDRLFDVDVYRVEGSRSIPFGEGGIIGSGARRPSAGSVADLMSDAHPTRKGVGLPSAAASRPRSRASPSAIAIPRPRPWQAATAPGN